jgi:histidyl-tRNA synthetase
VAVWVIDTTGGRAARDLTHELRAAGIGADRSFDDRSMRAQFRAADRSGARLAVVVGETELAEGTVSVRDLRGGDQELVARSDVVQHLRKQLD